MMLPMTQEFVSQLNDSEEKLNDEIDDLLNGIDFQQSMSQENSQNCIPSTFPEENGFNSMQENDVYRNEEVGSPLLFTQQEREEEEEEKQEVQMGNTEPFNVLDMNVFEDSGLQKSSNEDPFMIISATPEENLKVDQEIPAAPILQPFTCSQKKDPLPNEYPMDTLEEVYHEDPMDILEEVSVTDIGDTYLNDEEFNKKYPLQSIAQSQQQIEERMETVPHVMNYDEIGVFLDEQEKIGQLLGQNNNVNEMDNFILGDVLNITTTSTTVPVPAAATSASTAASAASTSKEMEVEVNISSRQSNQVCYF